MKFVIVNQNEPTTEIYHYGIKGQKWGIRRFQNPDGTLTDAGRKRYLNSDGSLTKKGEKFVKKQSKGNRIREFDIRHRLQLETDQKYKEAKENLKKSGYTIDYTFNDGTLEMAKNIKTKHGDVTFSTMVHGKDLGREPSIKDMKRTESHYNKYGTKINNMIDKEWKKRDSNENITLGKVDNIRTLVDDHGTSIVVAKPVILKSNGKAIGIVSAGFDGKTGKMDYGVPFDS